LQKKQRIELSYLWAGRFNIAKMPVIPKEIQCIHYQNLNGRFFSKLEKLAEILWNLNELKQPK
jgi:hypothetical protein